MTKIFENDNLVVIQMVSVVGSVDTMHIDRKNKRFLLSATAMSVPIAKTVAVTQYSGSIK